MRSTPAQEMLSLQSLCSLFVLRNSSLVPVESEPMICAITAHSLLLPLPSEIDPRNRDTLRNLQGSFQIMKEMKTVDKIRAHFNCGRLDLVDRLLEKITSQQKKIKLTIDLHELSEDGLAQYVEKKGSVDYNYIYTNPRLLYRVTRRSVFNKLVEAGLNLERNFRALLSFDYAFCRSYYYPYNQWILESLSKEALAREDMMVCYENYHMAIVRDGVVEVVSEIVV